MIECIVVIGPSPKQMYRALRWCVRAPIQFWDWFYTARGYMPRSEYEKIQEHAAQVTHAAYAIMGEYEYRQRLRKRQQSADDWQFIDSYGRDYR